MASYPQELARDAAYQSHTSRLTELWSLPRPAQGLNTNNNNNNNNTYHPDNLCLRERGCEDPSLFFSKPKGIRVQKRLSSTASDLF